MSTISAISDAAASARGSVNPVQCERTVTAEVMMSSERPRCSVIVDSVSNSQPAAERALRAPHALADRIDLARAAREEREDLVGFTEIARAQHDRVGRVRAFD